MAYAWIGPAPSLAYDGNRNLSYDGINTLTHDVENCPTRHAADYRQCTNP